jgi:glutamyl-tRNA synthetase
MTVITRFAPSPTGMLHIGSARTALFNYLFARHCGGKFLLRVEDTDMARNSDASYQAILDGLAWLGVHFDGDVVYQSKRAERHREVALELVKRGGAYYCYTTPDELAEQRAAAEAKGEVFKYDRKWRPAERTSPSRGEVDAPASGGGSLPDAQKVTPTRPAGDLPPEGGGKVSPTPPPGVTPSIRIKAPLSGEVIVRDAVQGDVHFGPDALDDLVILRSDGTPTYNLAVVVDDHDMGVTHIIRGDDHLTNAGRQSVIYQAMGWEIPVFAHIPLIHGPDGAKLSKRHGATSTTEYAAMGYLPEAMRNYLAKLGWGHGDDEIFSDAQAIEWFTLEHIGKAPSRLDFAKLNHVNAHYMRAKSGAELAALLGIGNRHPGLDPGSQATSSGLSMLPEIPAFAGMTVPATLDIAAALDSVKTKASTLVELKDAVAFYLAAPTAFDEKASATLAKSGANIPLILPALETLAEPWTAESVKAAIVDVATATSKKIGELMPPIRAAIVGSMSGPDIPDALAILGKAESLARLNSALK